MKREFLKTKDGSITIHLPDWDEQYHSVHGAINEAKHVFIGMGLDFVLKKPTLQDDIQTKGLTILEIGFGTGLNAFLTSELITAENLKISYTGVEAYPVEFSEVKQLNYASLVNRRQEDFLKFHETPWEKMISISENFQLKKQKKFFHEIDETDVYDLIYFDAFGARVQPDLWTEEIFRKMYQALRKEGVLVTYSAKGSVRRAMQAVGFKVERLPGPPGKREMLRALKIVM